MYNYRNVKAAKEQKRERGRPNKFRVDEKWGRTTVILRDWEIAFLDRLAVDIREEAGLAVNRSDLIREAIGVLVNAQNDGRLELNALAKNGISAQLNALIGHSSKK
jgi:hypothetical protein